VLELDGGEAGGQFIRTAVTLSILTDTPVRLTDVRGGRSEPGLKPQHLAAVEALASLSDASVTGADLGSTTVEFDPDSGPVHSQSLTVDVGTAGSVALVFDAVLPLAATLAGPVSLTATGGTDVSWSPLLAYLDRIKLPVLRRHGVSAAVERERTGFYPAGGGRATLHVGPSTVQPLALTERGTGHGVDVVSVASDGLADADVAERQARAARGRVEDAGLTVRHLTSTYAETESPGTSVLVALDYAATRGGFSALGERGTPAEDVGEEAATAALAFHEGSAVVDRHMADQLLVFAATAGGTVVVPAVTDHVETSLELLATFGASSSVQSDDPTTRLVVDPLELPNTGSGSRDHSAQNQG